MLDGLNQNKSNMRKQAVIMIGLAITTCSGAQALETYPPSSGVAGQEAGGLVNVPVALKGKNVWSMRKTFRMARRSQ